MNMFGVETKSNSDIEIIGIPFDSATSIIPGARFAPRAILNESINEELYSSYLNKSLDDDEQKTFNYTELETSVDINVMQMLVYNYYKDLKNIPVTIGGDHSLTYPIVKALYEKYPDLIVIQFDAHTDLRHVFMDSAHSHACVMRNISDLIGVENIKQFGIRNGERSHFEFMKAHDTLFTNLYDLFRFIKTNTRPMYFTLDMDVFDNLPGTGSSVPGGISFHDFISFVKVLNTNNTLVGFDIMELAPNNDVSGYSTKVATACLKELLLLFRK